MESSLPEARGGSLVKGFDSPGVKESRTSPASFHGIFLDRFHGVMVSTLVSESSGHLTGKPSETGLLDEFRDWNFFTEPCFLFIITV